MEEKPIKIVPVIGGFEKAKELLDHLDHGRVVAPLTPQTAHRAAQLEQYTGHPAFKSLHCGGIVFFTSATTGAPKVVLHDFYSLQQRAKHASTHKGRLRVMSLLGFDHIGGINTLLYAKATGQPVIVPDSLNPIDVLRKAAEMRVELLPTTPSFMRMCDPQDVPRCVEMISYGSERMDELTLKRWCAWLPGVEFRQLYGSTETGILRTKSERRDSVWFTIRDPFTIEEDGELLVRPEMRAKCYLSGEHVLAEDGWHRTGDIVETRSDSDWTWLRVVGRKGTFINCGGEKVMPSEIEDIALRFPGVERAKARGVPNAVLGEAIELDVRVRSGFNAVDVNMGLGAHLRFMLPDNRRPHRIRAGHDLVPVNHRMKEEG